MNYRLHCDRYITEMIPPPPKKKKKNEIELNSQDLPLKHGI